LSRQFLSNAAKTLRYPRWSLIRCALGGLPRRGRGRFCHHRVPDSSKAFAYFAKRNLTSMLPGFRFLFAAIVLSMSILIFGLGAVALLRTAHEEFASTPAWYPAPEARLAQDGTAAKPVLAMLRVDDAPKSEQPAPTAGQPTTDNVPTAVPAEHAATAPAEQAATVPVEQTAAPTEPQPPSDRIAALQPQDSLSEATGPEAVTPKAATSETTTSPTMAPENPPRVEAAPSPADAATPAEATKVATTEPAAPPARDAAPVVSPDAAPATLDVLAPQVPPAPEQASAPASPGLDSTSTKIATLGGPPVDITTGSKAKAANAKPDQSAIRKRAQALLVARRRRIAAAQARMARLVAQRPMDPFAQSLIPAAQPAITAR
jgi:hypothetical protein